MAPGQVRKYVGRKKRVTAEDFRDNSPTEGSLWASTGQTNYYFTQNRIRSVGDIITITLEDPFIRDIKTEVKRTLSEDEVTHEIDKAQDRIRMMALGMDPEKPADQQRPPGRRRRHM